MTFMKQRNFSETLKTAIIRATQVLHTHSKSSEQSDCNTEQSIASKTPVPSSPDTQIGNTVQHTSDVPAPLPQDH